MPFADGRTLAVNAADSAHAKRCESDMVRDGTFGRRLLFALHAASACRG